MPITKHDAVRITLGLEAKKCETCRWIRGGSVRTPKRRQHMANAWCAHPTSSIGGRDEAIDWRTDDEVKWCVTARGAPDRGKWSLNNCGPDLLHWEPDLEA
jgi:hypothetical protein